MKRKSWHIDAVFIAVIVCLYFGVEALVPKIFNVSVKDASPWIILREGDFVDGKPVCIDGVAPRDWKCADGRRL